MYTEFMMEEELMDTLSENYERREDYDAEIENEFQNLYRD